MNATTPNLDKYANRRVEQKPSDTALLTALRRAMANEEFRNEKFGPDYLAEFFLPKFFRFFLRFQRIRRGAQKRLDGIFPGLTEFVIARTAYFDSLFVDALSQNVPQIVLLGAGYDSRAYRFAKINRDTRVFELDIAPTQNRKIKCLKKAGIEIPQAVTFAPINFNVESLKEVLEAAGYDSHDETLFLWEGVSYYLDPESVDTTLAFVRDSINDKSRIAFDYTITISDENIDKYYGVKGFVQAMNKHHANEGLVFSLEEGTEEAFFEQRGLKIVNHLNNVEIEKTYLTDDEGLLMGHMTGHFRFVLVARK
jgi:methyltransferase (TIGR00027 family)